MSTYRWTNRNGRQSFTLHAGPRPYWEDHTGASGPFPYDGEAYMIERAETYYVPNRISGTAYMRQEA